MTDFLTNHIPDPRDTSFTEDVATAAGGGARSADPIQALRYMSEGYDNHFNAGAPNMAQEVDKVAARIAELEAELAALKRCGNCKHAELETHYSGSGYLTFTDVRLECDDYFPGEEWCESGGWVKDEFPVTTLGSSCHFASSRWTARQDGES
jgi:hypothetical protein